ncbi:single-stranded-DNA-specific exonuclease RecJ [Thermincola ferriacetica]|uniref:Single-stranded-DNA-specific exonuclease RecJ n=1 Tax=Thermincola ferriacetica TaxID=281456 RepID=A0A0L6W679_9FIRM|nr:single-stranded-DNA-specific exonuclease RecJ [Thermincola ferriacetica]KNZ71087.1 single-stranded-DNA-specific exonuclease RecJ [Thermincola ferriacetica]
MEHYKTIWSFHNNNTFIQELLARRLGISKITAQILANRGICSVEEARTFLFGSLEDLYDPLQMHGMEEAVQRIKQAIKENQRILVYGDYDVDGITSTVLLLDTLEFLGAACDFYIPHRLTEGYGLNINSLKTIKEQGFNLVITVDCGISSADEVSWARDNGLEIIITDHHEPPEHIPQAYAVINPKQAWCTYPFKELAGVGVAFKLAQALLRAHEKEYLAPKLLDLVALGTVADMVPLVGENRITTKQGLQLINAGHREGLAALIEVAGLADQSIDSEQISFALAPRLNAVGRIDHAAKGVRLLREKNREKAVSIAKALDRANKERQAIENLIFTEAVEIIESNSLLDNKAFVLARPDWHLGIVGIVASKLVNRYCRPVILLSVNGEVAKGSARSIPGFNLFAALQSCEAFLKKYGGHSQAAGLTLNVDDISAFTAAFNEIVDQQITAEHMAETLPIDGEISFKDVTFDLYNQLVALEPFGFGNPTPLFACRQADIIDCRKVGSDGKHLKMKIMNEKLLMEAIGFNLSACKNSINFADKIDIVFELKKNDWNGRSNLQLNVRAIKQAGSPDNPFRASSPSAEQETPKSFLDELFDHAAEYLVDDYYRNIGEKEEFYTKVVGVSFDNRQEIVARLREGEKLFLVREHNNPHDPNAVRVENRSGEQVGYLNARLAKHFAPLLDKGEQYLTLVSNVTGGQDKNYGLNIIIQKVQDKSFAEKRAILADIRKRLKSLDEKKLLEAVRGALLGPYPYRESQLAALQSLLEGNNTLAIFGTGRGKSAVFQSMAVYKAIKEDALTIIVYPLRALVNDQYEAMLNKLSALGMRIYKGNGTLSAGERAMLFAVLEAGDIDILLTTPEFLSFHMEKILAMPKKIGLFVVDESHHISMSSLSHRPAYKRISHIAEGLGRPLTLAVTATANDEVAQEIIAVLAINQVVIDPYVRKNLQLIDKRGIEDKSAYIKQVLATGGKTIIYVNSRLKAVELALMLREANPHLADKIAYYHAGLKNEHRHTIEKMFKEGELLAIVATSAFGEGIDIPDVRHVVLYHLNFNFTEFNQQSGRAGRDGGTSHIHLLCGPKDIRINEFILELAAPGRDFLAALYTALQQLKNDWGEIRLTNKEIAHKMEKAGMRLAKDSSVSCGLGILEELGLIRRESVGRERQIFVNPPPGNKINLENSLRFLEGQEEKAAFQEFQQAFFDASSEELLNQVNRAIFPSKYATNSGIEGQMLNSTLG